MPEKNNGHTPHPVVSGVERYRFTNRPGDLGGRVRCPDATYARAAGESASE